MAPLPYYGVFKLGSFGSAISGLKRAVYRLLKDEAKWQGYLAQTTAQRRTFGPYFVKDLTLIQRLMTAGVVEGQLDQPTLRALESHSGFDAEAKRLWLAQKPAPVPLIEPHQGFVSLVSDLWMDYTVGRNMGLMDGPRYASGTYNPGSLLPSGSPSDHATSRLDGRIGEPACAFDLDIIQHIGWSNLNARAFFNKMAGRKEVHYVILGNKIWSIEKGLHEYTDGGHENHVHTSGYRR